MKNMPDGGYEHTELANYAMDWLIKDMDIKFKDICCEYMLKKSVKSDEFFRADIKFILDKKIALLELGLCQFDKVCEIFFEFPEVYYIFFMPFGHHKPIYVATRKQSYLFEVSQC